MWQKNFQFFPVFYLVSDNHSDKLANIFVFYASSLVELVRFRVQFVLIVGSL